MNISIDNAHRFVILYALYMEVYLEKSAIDIYFSFGNTIYVK